MLPFYVIPLVCIKMCEKYFFFLTFNSYSDTGKVLYTGITKIDRRDMQIQRLIEGTC